MRQTRSILIAGVALCALGGWGSVRGNGESKTELRAAEGFTEVRNETSLDVEIERGAAFAVSVTADSNILPLVLTRVDGKRLTISTKESFSTKAPGKVHIAMPSLEKALTEGSGDVRISGFAGPGPLAIQISGSGSASYDGSAGDCRFVVSGSGNVVAKGKGGRLTLEIDGSGAADLAGFTVSGVVGKLTGSGSANLTVNGDADLELQGSGAVHATLNGGKADLSSLGSGSILWTGNSVPGKLRTQGSGAIEHR